MYRVQRKSVLQLVIWASCSWHVLAQKSFHLARKKLLMNSPKKVSCPSGKSRTEFSGHIAKSTSPVLSDTTFFARWSAMKNARKQSNFISKSICDMPGFGLWGRHGGLWYCSVELFSSCISVILILTCSIALSFSPAVCGFSSFWLITFGKFRRSFTLLWYHSFGSPI